MASDYAKNPEIEELVGAGFSFEEAVSFQRYVAEAGWPARRVWEYVLKRESKSFPKLDRGALAAWLKDVTGTDQLAEMR